MRAKLSFSLQIKFVLSHTNYCVKSFQMSVKSSQINGTVLGQSVLVSSYESPLFSLSQCLLINGNNLSTQNQENAMKGRCRVALQINVSPGSNSTVYDLRFLSITFFNWVQITYKTIVMMMINSIMVLPEEYLSPYFAGQPLNLLSFVSAKPKNFMPSQYMNTYFFRKSLNLGKFSSVGFDI